MIQQSGRVASSMTRLVLDLAAAATRPGVERRAAALDFAVASTIDRTRVSLTRGRRVDALAERLQSQIEALDALRPELPAGAVHDVETRKEEVTWLLSELRRGI